MSELLDVKKDSDAASLVDYFEVGCCCLIAGKISKPKTNDVNKNADYYMDNCTCSRHPESAKRECWDRNLNASEKRELRALSKT